MICLPDEVEAFDSIVLCKNQPQYLSDRLRSASVGFISCQFPPFAQIVCTVYANIVLRVWFCRDTNTDSARQTIGPVSRRENED